MSDGQGLIVFMIGSLYGAVIGACLASCAWWLL